MNSKVKNADYKAQITRVFIKITEDLSVEKLKSNLLCSTNQCKPNKNSKLHKQISTHQDS